MSLLMGTVSLTLSFFETCADWPRLLYILLLSRGASWTASMASEFLDATTPVCYLDSPLSGSEVTRNEGVGTPDCCFYGLPSSSFTVELFTSRKLILLAPSLLLKVE